MWGIELVVMAAMISVNSVLAAYEIALASVSLARLEAAAAEPLRGGDAAAYMKRNMEGSLAGVQLGITLVGAVAAATGGAGAEEQLAPTIQVWLGVPEGTAEVLGIAAVVLPLTAVTIIFGELIPKVFALKNKEWVCLRLSPPMKWFVTLVWPVVWLLETAVTGLMAWGERLLGGGKAPEPQEAAALQELRASASLARTSRLIGPQQESIILRAAELSARPVRAVMLPADAMSMLHADAPVSEALVVAHLDMHTRFPVTERPGDPQAVVGYVNFKDIVAHMRLAPEGPSLRKITRAITSLPEDTPLSACLERLVRGRGHIALVRDAAGRVTGMVTLEDVIEELVGDIEDEYDTLPVHAAVSGRGWVMGGGVTPEEFRRVTGAELPPLDGAGPPRHLSDWVCGARGGPARGGEVVERGGLRVAVRKVRRRQVLEAQVERRSA